MNALPQSYANYRSPRARLESLTPAVLRFPDGRQSRGELRVVSATGGLLRLPGPVNRGSRVKVMFLTQTGAVLGAAEMLEPLSWALQPFRFVSLDGADQCRLRGVIQSSLGQNGAGDEWLDRYRAKRIRGGPPRKRISRRLLAGLTLAAVLACAAIVCRVFLK